MDAAFDLFLGSACEGCRAPGRMLCARCRAGLPAVAVPAWPTPVPGGLVAPWAAGVYEGTLRELVVGHKDHGRFGHRRVLGSLLAIAVTSAIASVPDAETVLLVPVPSRPGATRRRGYDPTAALTRTAARLVSRARPGPVRAVRLLRSRGAVVDQAGLDARAREVNVSGSMWCPGSVLSGLSRASAAMHVVVCDDILTTGSSAREAQRALTAVGLEPLAVAAVVATPRRST